MLSALNRSAPRLLVPAISNASTKTPFRRLSTIASARRYVSPARLACTPTSRGFRSAPPRASMNAAEYSKLSDETMETLYEALDNWCEANDGVDVDYSVRGRLLPPSPPSPHWRGLIRTLTRVFAGRTVERCLDAYHPKGNICRQQAAAQQTDLVVVARVRALPVRIQCRD